MPPKKQYDARLPAVAVPIELYRFMVALSTVRGQQIAATMRQAAEFYRDHYHEEPDEQAQVQAILENEPPAKFDSTYRKYREVAQENEP